MYIYKEIEGERVREINKRVFCLFVHDKNCNNKAKRCTFGLKTRQTPA